MVAIGKAFKIDDVDKMSRPQICAAIEDVVVEKIAKSATPSPVERTQTNNNLNNLRRMLNKTPTPSPTRNKTPSPARNSNSNSNSNSGWNELEMLLNGTPTPSRPSVMNQAIRNHVGNKYNKLDKSVVTNYNRKFNAMAKAGTMGNNEIRNRLMKDAIMNKRITNLEREDNRVVSREVLNNGTVVEVVKRADGQEVTLETI